MIIYQVYGDNPRGLRLADTNEPLTMRMLLTATIVYEDYGDGYVFLHKNRFGDPGKVHKYRFINELLKAEKHDRPPGPLLQIPGESKRTW
jgi:hypothetical protein